MNIVVIGSLNMDVVIGLDKYPEDKETVFGHSPKYIPGGKGANQAVAISRLGASVSMVGLVGDDVHGKTLRRSLISAGVNTDYLGTIEGSSGLAFIHVSSDGGNRIIVSPGSNMKLNRDYIDAADALLRTADAVLVQLEIPLDTVQYVVKKSRDYEIPVFLDPSPVQEIPVDMMENVDWIFPNEYEAGELTGQPIQDIKTAKIASSKLLQLGVHKVVVKLGERGALYAHDNEFRYVPGIPVKAIDSTAAGDAFCGAFVFQYLKTGDVLSTMKFANVAGSLAVTKLGAQSSLPTLQEVVHHLNEHSDV